MESYHDYLEHIREHKYIRKERTSSGKWRYYYPEDSSGPVQRDKTNVQKSKSPHSLTKETDTHVGDLSPSAQRERPDFKNNVAENRVNRLTPSVQRDRTKEPPKVEMITPLDQTKTRIERIKTWDPKFGKYKTIKLLPSSSPYRKANKVPKRPKNGKTVASEIKNKINNILNTLSKSKKDLEKKVSIGKRYISEFFNQKE